MQAIFVYLLHSYKQNYGSLDYERAITVYQKNYIERLVYNTGYCSNCTNKLSFLLLAIIAFLKGVALTYTVYFNHHLRSKFRPKNYYSIASIS